MDTQKSKHLSTAFGHQPGATNLAIYGCGQPVTDMSSNSSTVTSVTSTAGSDEDHSGANQRRSPFSSDSSEHGGMPLPSGRAHEKGADSHRPNTTMAATAYTSKSKSARKESHQEEAHAGTMSPCDHCKTAQQQHTCSFYSEPVSHAAKDTRSPHKKDTAPVRKETSIAVQRNSASQPVGQPTKQERRGARPTAGAHVRRMHGSGSDRLPLHRIMNDPRVFYVVTFAGLAALILVSATGIALAAHRRRRRRRRSSWIRGLSTAKDMATAVVTTWVTFSRWFRRLLFK